METYDAPSVPIDTRAVHAGRGDLTGLGVHALPIDLSTTTPLPSVAAGGDAYDWLAGGHPLEPGQTAVYARLWNGTVARFEEGLAALEGADAAVAFASGMAAMSAVLLSLAPERRHIVAVRPLYGGTDHLLATGLLGTTVTYAAIEQVAASITGSTGLVVLETPGNPTLELIDIRAVVEAIASTGFDVPLLVDNTFATPVLQQPLEHGASMVLHSATKFIGGHGDALGGVVATSGDLAMRLRPVRAITGGILHPWAAYLLHRGLATLPVRVRAQQASATRVAAALSEHPSVSRVWHPSLSECDPLALIGRQQSGPGAVLAFELAGGYAAAASVAEHVGLITHAVSLGGVDTLIQHPAALTHRVVAEEARPKAGVLRVSVGLEDVDDIIADLEKAIAGV
ncbi:MAG: PLP-dependent aspartate aminotransferase family protein [Dermatophilaceae bacterium]|nr:PLP-dependent transferase [Intrasporangiaceae bacterium]